MSLYTPVFTSSPQSHRSGEDQPLAPYIIRPLCLEDEQRLQDFFLSHSEETIQLRYGYMIRTMTHERAAALVNVDQRKDAALGIFEIFPDQREVLHAVGRYFTEKHGHAEVAFVVRESKRGQGFATHLLRRLAAMARDAEITTFHAQVLRDNRPMRHIFERYHPKVRPVAGANAVLYTIPVGSILEPNPGDFHSPHGNQAHPTH